MDKEATSKHKMKALDKAQRYVTNLDLPKVKLAKNCLA